MKNRYMLDGSMASSEFSATTMCLANNANNCNSSNNNNKNNVPASIYPHNHNNNNIMAYNGNGNVNEFNSSNNSNNNNNSNSNNNSINGTNCNNITSCNNSNNKTSTELATTMTKMSSLNSLNSIMPTEQKLTTATKTTSAMALAIVSSITTMQTANKSSTTPTSPPISLTTNGHHHHQHQQHSQHHHNQQQQQQQQQQQLYPSITPTYWQPAPNPAPYLVPERKLFVGMLNKKYNEADVRQLFSGHGTIEECTVLRDQNGQSKGCAFVTFDTKQHAIGAIKTLHHSQTMEGCSAPLVVKFADTQKEKDQKKLQQLQVGICGITNLATPPAQTAVIGTLTAPSTPATALSPTTALVPTPVAATARSNPAMAALHAAIAAPPPTMANATCATTAGLIPTSAASLSAVTPTMLATAVSTAHHQTSPYLTTADAMIPNSAAAAAAAQMQIFQQLQAFGLQPAHYLQGLNFPPDHSTTAASLPASAVAAAAAAASNNPAAGNGLLATPISMQNLVTLAALNPGTVHSSHVTHGATGHHHNVPTSQALTFNAAQMHHHQQQQQQHHHQQHQAHMAQLTAAHQMSMAAATPPSLAAHFASGPVAAHHHALWTGAEALTSPYAPALNPLANGAYAAATAPLTASALQAAAAGVAGKQIEGPEGSNLFIYHLPQEFTDTDLASTFLPFGNVLSAKVFIDKQTNLSKCFGFVSYDNPLSASAAIQAMHGFQIGTKRLKVQLKRSKDAAKPY